MREKFSSTVTIASWMFWRSRPVEAVPVLCMSRFWVVSEWPQMSVPPRTGSSAACAAMEWSPGPSTAPPIRALEVARNSLRFMVTVLVA